MLPILVLILQPVLVLVVLLVLLWRSSLHPLRRRSPSVWSHHLCYPRPPLCWKTA
jgi:hypothetical protein